MGLKASIGFQIPTNVVEVGNEITADQIAAINAASSPSAGNPFATSSFVTGQGYITGVPAKSVTLASSGGSGYTATASDFGNIIIFDVGGMGTLTLDGSRSYPDGKELLIFAQNAFIVNAYNFTGVYGYSMFTAYSWVRAVQSGGYLYLA